MTEEKTCINCGVKFFTKTKVHYFCSKKCRVERYTSQFDISHDKHLSPGKKGAINELVVSIELMRKGMCIYRALSPSSDTDIIATKAGRIYRVEITAGIINGNGSLYHPRHDAQRYDVICVVTPGNKISYFDNNDAPIVFPEC